VNTATSPSAARRILVTGGNRGIGHALVSHLVTRGDRVIMTARDKARGRAARDKLVTDHPTAEIDLRIADLSSPGSIRALGSDLRAAGERLDAVINNAGVLMAPPTRQLTAEGVEITLATNALGPMLLCEELSPILAPGARVVSLTSRLHETGSRGDPVDFDAEDPNLDHGYTADRAYKNSKLALIWVSSELDRRLPDTITSNTVCPGFAPTTAARYTRGWTRFKLRWIVPRLPFAVTLEQAADDVLWALDATELAGRGGLYLKDRTIAEPSADATDRDQAVRFWNMAHSLWPPLVNPDA
jgi:NAD(P)-dependent dehydrogenase (short-subunit alcohol dehydrogenase family)